MSTTIDSEVTGVLTSAVHAGSDDMLMTGFGAGVPSKATFPVMVAAVAASTFFASGAAAGDEGLEDLLLSDPHADIAASRAASAIAW